MLVDVRRISKWIMVRFIVKVVVFPRGKPTSGHSEYFLGLEPVNPPLSIRHFLVPPRLFQTPEM